MKYDKGEIIDLIGQGHSYKETARIVGCSQQWANFLGVSAGFIPPKTYKLDEEDKDVAVQMHINGYTCDQIGDFLGCSASNIARVLRKRGFKGVPGVRRIRPQRRSPRAKASEDNRGAGP